MPDRVEERKFRRERLLRRVGIALGGLGIVAMLVLSTYASVSNNETLHTVRSCTEPTGECYQRSQRQTGDVVASINQIATYAATCADRPGAQSLAEIRACIRDLITAAELDAP